MKAAWLERYSKGEVHLTVGERPKPQPGAKDVLLRVSVAAVNPLDNMIVHGEVKAIVPYKTPLVMGNECVGIVEETGASVTRFKRGERVYHSPAAGSHRRVCGVRRCGRGGACADAGISDG